MKTKVFAGIASLLVLACLVFAAVPAKADAISDVLTIFNPAGNPVHVVTASESEEGNGGKVFFIGVASLADPAQFGHPTVLCQAGTSPCDATTAFTSLSDIVGVLHATIGGHTFSFIGFTSDGENGLQPGIQAVYGGFGNSFIGEQAKTNTIVDVTYLLDPTLSSHGWTATFQSDAEVPEPASLVLMGTGLLGLMGLSRRFLR